MTCRFENFDVTTLDEVGEKSLSFKCFVEGCNRTVAVPRSPLMSIPQSLAIGERRVKCGGCRTIWVVAADFDGTIFAGRYVWS